MEYQMNLEQISAYQRKLKEDEKSDATIRKYVHDVMYFYQYLGEDRTFQKETVIAYKQELKARYQLSSANSMLVALNGFFAFCGCRECTVRTFKIQKQMFYDRERELTKEDYQKLVRTAEQEGRERLALLMQTIAATGIRVSELEYITREAVQAGRAQVSCKGKCREILITKELRKKLLRYCREKEIRSGCVFRSRTGRRLSRGAVWAEMKKLCARAGVAACKVFPHNLRHLFARTYYKKRKDIVYLADILGHSSINTTRIYTVTNANEHERLLARLGLVV